MLALMDPLKLIKITQDHCDLLFKWANDPVVRENSFNPQPINYEDHILWFKDKITSKHSVMYLCLNSIAPVGQIRVDFQELSGVISFSIAREYRGLGYGSMMLKLLVKNMRNSLQTITDLIGKVKKNNVVSQHAFEKAGFLRIMYPDYIEYKLKI